MKLCPYVIALSIAISRTHGFQSSREASTRGVHHNLSPKSSDKMSVSEPKFKKKWTPFSGDSASSDISDLNSFVNSLSKDGKVTTSDISQSEEMLANNGVSHITNTAFTRGYTPTITTKRRSSELANAADNFSKPGGKVSSFKERMKSSLSQHQQNSGVSSFSSFADSLSQASVELSTNDETTTRETPSTPSGTTYTRYAASRPATDYMNKLDTSSKAVPKISSYKERMEFLKNKKISDDQEVSSFLDGLTDAYLELSDFVREAGNYLTSEEEKGNQVEDSWVANPSRTTPTKDTVSINTKQTIKCAPMKATVTTTRSKSSSTYPSEATVVTTIKKATPTIPIKATVTTTRSKSSSTYPSEATVVTTIKQATPKIKDATKAEKAKGTSMSVTKVPSVDAKHAGVFLASEEENMDPFKVGIFVISEEQKYYPAQVGEFLISEEETVDPSIVTVVTPYQVGAFLTSEEEKTTPNKVGLFLSSEEVINNTNPAQVSMLTTAKYSPATIATITQHTSKAVEHIRTVVTKATESSSKKSLFNKPIPFFSKLVEIKDAKTNVESIAAAAAEAVAVTHKKDTKVQPEKAVLPSTKQTKSSPSSEQISEPTGSLAIVPINKNNLDFTAGLLGGVTGFALGGPVLAMILAFSSNYVSRGDGNMSKMIRSYAKSTIDTYNFLARLEAKSNLLQKSRESLNKVYQTVLKTEGVNSEQAKKLETMIGQVTSKIEKVNDDYDVVGAGFMALGVLGDVVEISVVKIGQISGQYKVDR